MEKILFYKTNDPYGFLNNFKKARMFIFGRWWNNVESPYQASKAIHSSDFHAIWMCKTPREAMNLGRSITVKNNWEEVKNQTMYECIFSKFTQNHDLLQQLLDTEHSELIEDSPIDSYWGRGPNWDGINQLGKTLMKVREELRGF